MSNAIIVKHINGFMFGVEVHAARHVRDLANGDRGYEATVTFHRDGRRIGAGLWEPEGFAAGCPDLTPFGENDGDVYRKLAAEVRDYLGRLSAD